MLPSGQKLTFGLLATITLEVVLSHAHAPFLSLPKFFKFILEIVYCVYVQHCLQFCLGNLSCVKMAVPSVGETEEGGRQQS
jgi:hypothetical protein